MNKKIIFLLLFLFLTLSLLSCKEVGDVIGPGGYNNSSMDTDKEEDNTGTIVDKVKGLVSSFDELPVDEVFKREHLFSPEGENYPRNPVIVVLGAGRNQIAVFAEKRYGSKGSDNDVGINGKDLVDIVVRVSTNAGIDFSQEAVVGTKAATHANSHGAPVVYKVADNKVVICSTSGGGLARTAESAENKPVSRIDYIVGTLNGDSFTWTGWQEVKFSVQGDLLNRVKAMKVNGGFTYSQIGTKSARGIFNSANNKLILPVIMAYMGHFTDVYELMGCFFIEGTLNGDNITWTGNEKYTLMFANDSTYFSRYKETIIIGGSSIYNIKSVFVPNYRWRDYTLFGTNQGISSPQNSKVYGGDGSPSYLTLKWHGASTYDPSAYTNEQADRSLFLGAKDDAGNVTLHLMGKDTFNSEEECLINTGKSGSIDVLGDGTVVTASEEDFNEDKVYLITFNRFSQSYLTSLFK